MRRQLLLSTVTTLAFVVAGCSGDSSSSTGFNTSASTNGNSTSGGTDSATSTSSGGGPGGTSDGTGGGPGGGSSGGGSSGGGGFIQDPDGGMGSIECDVWTQDCDPGEKCMPWANDGGNSWNSTKCSPVDPNPKQPGDSCTVEGNGVSGVDDCDVASMCWNVDPETNMGTCVAFCKGSPDMPTCDDPNSFCLIANDGVLILCLPGCDPLLQDCNMGEVCIPNTSNDGFACVLDASGGMGTAGVPCEFANVCNPGLLCVDAQFVPGCMGSAGCCVPFCDVTDPNANDMCNNAFDTPGAQCVPYFDMGMAPPGHEDVGVCIIPQ